jgi:hypothetical protein
MRSDYSTESDSTVAREFASPFAIAAHEKRSLRKVAKPQRFAMQALVPLHHFLHQGIWFPV